MTQNICFIGGGNMASSLVGGLISNHYPATNITVTDPDPQKLEQLQEHYAIQVNTDNAQATAQADILILAVKPQVLAEVCASIKATVTQKQPLIISIAAGIRSTDIDRWLGNQNAIVRCMPNTPSLIQAGATGLYANELCSTAQKNSAEDILKSAGITLWVDNEPLLDAVTAVSGSGPAYFFLFMEAMQAAGCKLGLNPEVAGQLAKQTALGAARMAVEGNDDPATLRAKVTSKGGTTAAALSSFEENHFTEIVERALYAARNRATELADELGNHPGDHPGNHPGNH